LGQGDIRAVALVDEVSARHLIGRTDLADVPCTCDEFPLPYRMRSAAGRRRVRAPRHLGLDRL